MRQPHKRLSAKTQDAIDRLYRPTWFGALFPGTENKKQIINEIVESGEVEVIPQLVPIALTNDREIAQASARAVGQLLGKLEPDEFVRFDEFVRQGDVDWRERTRHWYQLRVNELDQLAILGDEAGGVLGVASSHISGWVREAALQRLGRIRTGQELPFLLMRVNDWVPNVRAVAVDLLKKRICLEYATHFLKWLPLVLRLPELRRSNKKELVEAIQKLFEQSGAEKFLRRGCESSDLTVRRFCYKQLLKSPTADDFADISKALTEPDLLIRVQAIRAVGTRPPDPRYLQLLQTERHDSNSRVRQEVLRVYVDKYQSETGDFLEESLVETRRSFREEAQFFVEKAATTNLCEFYLKKIQSGDRAKLAGAIAGLGEKGNKQDAVLLEVYLENISSAVRAATVHALARLGRDLYLEKFLDALQDENQRVVREGIAALAKRANAIGGDRLWDTFEAAKRPQQKKGVLFLIARLSRWECLPYLLRALGDPDEEISDAGRKYLDRLQSRWNRSFVRPTQEQAGKLSDVLKTHGLLIPDELRGFFEREVRDV
jgi:HEAT repeat protein